MDRVQFEDKHLPSDIPIPRPKPLTFVDFLMRSGIVKSPTGAAFFMVIITALLIGASIYFLASAVPPPESDINQGAVPHW